MPDAIDRARIKAKISNDYKLRALKDDLSLRYKSDESLYEKYTRTDAPKTAMEKQQEIMDQVAASRPRKLLVSGDAKGVGLDKLFSTVEAQIAKMGSFDALLCVGEFLPSVLNADNDAQVSPYIIGEKKAPMECFFIDSSAMLLQAVPGGKTIGKNLHFLGGYGIREIAGLRVAFLSGAHDPALYDTPGADFVGGCFTGQAVSELKRLAATALDRSRGIDVLLTCGWPAGCENLVTAGELKPPVFEGEGDRPAWKLASAKPLAELCLALEPRYHIFGCANTFYQRPAFRAPRRKHACRLIGLGHVGSTSKQRKWLHALALSPMMHMKSDELQTMPTNVTQCPFFEGAGSQPTTSTGEKRPRLAFEGGAGGIWADALEKTLKRPRLGEGQAADAGPPDEAILALVSGDLVACRKAAHALRMRVVVNGVADGKLPSKLKMFAAAAAEVAAAASSRSVAEANSDEAACSTTTAVGTSAWALADAAAVYAPAPVPADINHEEDAARTAAAEAYLKRSPEVGVVRFTFTEGGQLGLRLSQDVPPWILEVKDGSLAARKAPRVPLGGIVVAINGYELNEQQCKVALKALSTRPVTLDILWPEDQALPNVVHA